MQKSTIERWLYKYITEIIKLVKNMLQSYFLAASGAT
jgi:hypothetical protein